MNVHFSFSEDYSDMLHLPPVLVEGHTRMSIGQRAAQFAPFAALSTHDGQAS